MQNRCAEEQEADTAASVDGLRLSVSRVPPPGCLVRFALSNRCLNEQGVPELRVIRIRLHCGEQPKSKATGKLIT